jgi:hypothetical protein
MFIRAGLSFQRKISEAGLKIRQKKPAGLTNGFTFFLQKCLLSLASCLELLVLVAEFVNTTGSIHQLHLTGVKWMSMSTVSFVSAQERVIQVSPFDTSRIATNL